MNTKTTKFLAVLAVFAMAFALFAAISPAESEDAALGAEGLYTYDAETATYTLIAADSDNEYKATEDVTLYAYTSDSDKIVSLTYSIVVGPGATVTLSSAGSENYNVLVPKAYKIDVSSATTSEFVLDGADVTIEAGGTYGTNGIVGGAAYTAGTAAKGTVIVEAGSALYVYDSSSESGSHLENTANLKVMAGGKYYANGTDAGQLKSLLIGAYGDAAGWTPSSSTTEGYILMEQVGKSGAMQKTYTLHMDTTIDDRNYKSKSLINSTDKVVIPVGTTVTIKEFSDGNNEGLGYGSVIENNGVINVTGKMYFKAATGAAVQDVSTIGFQGIGFVNVKNGGELVITEGSAIPGQSQNSSAINSMFAIGANTITVEKGGKLIAANNENTTEYWGIVGPTAATAAAPMNTELASLNTFIWAPTGDTAKVTIKASYLPKTETETYTYGAMYIADGTVQLGVTQADNGGTYDWADRFDQIMIYSGTTTAAGNFTMQVGYSGPALTVMENAKFNGTSGKTFTVVAGDMVNVKGDMDISMMTVTSPASITFTVFEGGVLKVPAPSPSTVEKYDYIAYQGGKIYHGTTDATAKYAEQTTVPVSNEIALDLAIEQGAKDIELIDNVTLEDNLKIPSGVLLTIMDGKTLTIPTGIVLEVKGTIAGKLELKEGGQIIEVAGKDDQSPGLSGDFTIKPGSVLINGVIAEGTIIVNTNDEIHVTGSLNGDLHIIAGTGAAAPTAAKVIFDNFTVNSTGKLYLQYHANITYSVGEADSDSKADKYFYLYGTIVPQGTDAVTINVDKPTATGSKKTNTFTAYGGAQLSGKVTVKGTGSIDISQAQNTLYVDEDISADKEFGQLESVEIIGSLSIKNNSTVTVYGTLTVKEGVTLTIESGSTLKVDSSIAKMIVDGRVIVEEGATLKVIVAKEVKINGTLISSGDLDIGNNDTTDGAPTVTIAKDGLVDIKDEDGSSIFIEDGLTVAAGGQLVVRHTMDIKEISNKGTIVLNGAILGANSKISMAGDKAVVEINSLNGNATTAYSLTITDLGMKFTSGKVVEGKENVVSIPVAAGKTFKGLTVTETITSYTDSTGTTYYNHMDLGGSMILVDDDGKAVLNTVTVTGNSMEVNGELTIGAATTLANAKYLYVNGEITAIATSDAGTATITGTAGMIYVYGEITTRSAIANAATYVSAAYYTADVLGETYHVYTSLAAAVEDGADSIKVFGNIAVSADLEIPADVIITIDAAGQLDIGSSTNNTVKVLVKDGGIIKNGKIVVYGAITFENKKNCKSAVDSDVTVENGDAVTYTSVYLAIANSSAGDVITISRVGKTTLPTSLTIPEDRTLKVPASRTLELAPGTTLTVNGMLETAEKITVKDDGEFAEKASLIDGTAAIKVNGVFRSMAELTYAYYVTSGAYYNYADATGNYNYVSPVATAVASSTKAIEVWGTVTAGEIEWSGTATTPKTFDVAIAAEFTATELKFAYVNFTVFDLTGGFTGTVTYGENSIVAENIDMMSITNPKVDNEYIMLVNAVNDNDDDDSFTVAAGEVYMQAMVGDLTVSEDATLMVPADGFTMYGNLTVDGIFYVDNGKNATVNGRTTVMGSIIVAAASDDGTKAKGDLTLDDVFLGITKKAVLGVGASLVGPMDFDILYAAPDAYVSEEILESEGLKYTAFYAEDELYLTAYIFTGDVYISDVKFVIETAKFEGWYNEKGVKATETVGKIGQTGWEVVEAEIEYDVYNLFVRTDNGIKSVAVNGKELINTGNNVFVSYDKATGLGFLMSAGKYTISFTLKDGYEGTPILYDADGKAVIGGYGITIDGNVLKEETTVTYQLNGTDPIPEPEPTPTPEPEKESEWNVTTILLLVLVILIAIMAVIVALRLNRN